MTARWSRNGPSDEPRDPLLTGHRDPAVSKAIAEAQAAMIAAFAAVSAATAASSSSSSSSS